MTHSLLDSQYIFQQNQRLSTILLTAAVVLLLLAISNIIIIGLKVDNNFTTKFKKIIRIDVSVFAIIFAIMFAYPTIKKDRLINRIKQNPAFTVGTTTQWIDLRGLSDDVEYYYTVNGRRYVSKASPVYGGEEIAGIQVPNGLYRVIYNLANPEESLIDFKIKEGETTNAEVN